MIHVTPAAEPASFGKSVRAPGLRAIAEMVGETPAAVRQALRKKGQTAGKRSSQTNSLLIGPRLWTISWRPTTGRALTHAFAFIP